jgi:hypothetical protein
MGKRSDKFKRNPRGFGNVIFEEFPEYIAPPGHVTFTVLNQENGGHSLSLAANEYPDIVHETKSAFSDVNAANMFKEAIAIIRLSAVCSGHGCQCEDGLLLYAFIYALLNHPNKRYRKSLKANINSSLKKSGGVHVILFMPPDGPSAWIIDDPSSRVQVH